MDLTSSVRTDTLPALGTLVVPGALALAPYAALFLVAHPRAASYLAAHEAIALSAAVVLSIGGGFLVESLGSYVEYYLLDRGHGDRAAMLRSWWRYLRIAWKVEPTGQHYLRRILAVFKFELNGCVAIITGLPGLAWIGCSGFVASGAGVSLVLGSAAAAAYLFIAASHTSQLLAQIRSQLLHGVGEPPFADDACSARFSAERAPLA
jgi:hypothetical protein